MDRIQFRRDTLANWNSVNPILLEGEIGYVLDDPNLHKMGDGVHTWNQLPFRGFDGTIVHDTGNSENVVMSQKAVTEKLSELGSEVGNLKGIVNISTSEDSNSLKFYLNGATKFVVSNEGGNFSKYSVGIYKKDGTEHWQAIDSSATFTYNSDAVDRLIIFVPSSYAEANGTVLFNVKANVKLDLDNIAEEVESLRKDTVNLGTKPIFTIGGLNGVTGEVIQSTTGAHTQFLSTEDYDSITYGKNYTNSQTIYYNDSNIPVIYHLQDISDGITVVNKLYKYFKVEVKRVDNNNIDNITDVMSNISFNKSSQLSTKLSILENEINSVNSRLGDYIINEKTVAGEYKLLKDIYLPNTTNSITIEVDENTASLYKGIEFSIELLLNGISVIWIPKMITGDVIYCTHTTEFNEVRLSIEKSLSIDGTFVGKFRTGIAKEVEELKKVPFINKIDFVQGLQRLDGTTSITDSNWIITPYLPTNTKINVFVRCIEVNLNSVASVSYYDENKNFIKEASYSRLEINGIFKPDTQYAYYRICGMSANFGNYEPYAFSDTESIQELAILEFITPKNVYLVANDVIPNSAYNRNYTPCVYLDHFFLGATKECKAVFEINNNIVLPFRFPAVPDANWNDNINNGESVVITKENHSIIGDKNTKFDINVVSTKSSVGKDRSVRLLCLGTSTTYGEGATYLSKGMSNVKPYHAICHELFKMDDVDFNGNTKFITLGTNRHNLNFNYNNENYNYEDFHEGYRGYSVADFMSYAKFTDEEGNFSILAYLNKYRNYNDDGTPMNIGDENIGTEITSSNIGNIRVCTPTHIVVQLGANGGGTVEQYQKIIDTIKSELPDVKIALTISDSMGVIFPSKYNIIDKRFIKWTWLEPSNDSSQSDPYRHRACFGVQKIYNEHFDNDNYKSIGVYVLPFFFCSNPTYFASRLADKPESVVVENSGKSIVPTGWYSNIHSDIRAHSNYAYQLYSWIKYTLAI